MLFQSVVDLLGDCISAPQHRLSTRSSFDAILNECLEKGESLVTRPLSESYHKLEPVIKGLKAGGGTALGEGFLAGLGLAMQVESLYKSLFYNTFCREKLVQG